MNLHLGQNDEPQDVEPGHHDQDCEICEAIIASVTDRIIIVSDISTIAKSDIVGIGRLSDMCTCRKVDLVTNSTEELQVKAHRKAAEPAIRKLKSIDGLSIHTA